MQPGKDIKLEFVARSLRWYNKRALEELQNALKKQEIGESGELAKSLHTGTESAASNTDGKAKIIFKEYGRMVDMGAGRGTSRKGKKTAKEKRALNKKRKPKKFYSPTVYGLLNPLISRLQYGLTDEVVAQIKTDLENVN